jgi:uncharacterized membrane protein
MERRCVTCHAAQPSDPLFAAAPGGVMLETPAQLQAYADEILAQVVQTRAMPLANRTAMTDAEREQIAAWLAAGAPLD